jgi:hypothetical protein
MSTASRTLSFSIWSSSLSELAITCIRKTSRLTSPHDAANDTKLKIDVMTNAAANDISNLRISFSVFDLLEEKSYLYKKRTQGFFPAFLKLDA